MHNAPSDTCTGEYEKCCITQGEVHLDALETLESLVEDSRFPDPQNPLS